MSGRAQPTSSRDSAPGVRLGAHLSLLLVLFFLVFPAAQSVAEPRGRLDSPDAIRRGMKSFTQRCAVCHGPNGNGGGVSDDRTVSPARNFHDPAWRRMHSPEEIFLAIRNGVPHTSMPPWRTLSEGETWDLVAFILSLGSNDLGGEQARDHGIGK